MRNRLEDLWKSAADDGASMPLGPTVARTEADFDELMEAWFLERSNSIEYEMLLSQAHQMIAHLLSEGKDTPVGRKKARRLLREIDRCFRATKAGEG